MQVFQLTEKAIWYGEMSFAPDGRWLALSGKPFTLVDTTQDRKPEELPLGDFRRGFAFVRGGAAIAYLPGGTLLREYELTTQQVRECEVQNGHPLSIASDPSGETLYLSLSGPRYGESALIRVLGAKDMKERANFGAVKDDLRALSMSADGRWLGATSYQRVRAWCVGGGKLPSRAAICADPKSGANCFALSADGAHLAIATSHGLEIWNSASGERVVHSGKHRRTVTEVACCPTKPVLVTGDNAGNVFLWDYTGRVLTRFDWGLNKVRGLAFAPDGLRCAAVDAKGKVVVWDVDV